MTLPLQLQRHQSTMSFLFRILTVLALLLALILSVYFVFPAIRDETNQDSNAPTLTKHSVHTSTSLVFNANHELNDQEEGDDDEDDAQSTILPSVSATPTTSTPALDVSDCTVSFKGTVEKFKGCEISKHAPVKIYYSVSDDETTVDTLVQVENPENDPYYIAFGWGHSQMVEGSGSLVIIAYANQAGSFTNITTYKLTRKSESGVKTTKNTQISDMKVDYTNGVLSGRYTSKYTNKTVKFIYAHGKSSDADYTKHSYHGRSGRGFGEINLVSSSSSSSSSSPSSSIRVRVHSVFMAFSWTVFAPFGVLVMRFFKMYNPITFQIHRTVNILASVLTIIGALLVIFTSDLSSNSVHRTIGYIVLALAIVQPIIGIIRPQKEQTNRHVPWYFIHATLGTIAILLGFINVYTGIALGWFLPKVTLNGLVTASLVIFFTAFSVFSAMPRKFPTREEVSGIGIQRIDNRNLETAGFNTMSDDNNGMENIDLSGNRT